MCSKIREKKLKSGTLDAELVKMCSSILVHNIDNSDRYDEDFITLYFNSSKKSGGGGVEKVCLLGSGKAMVTFEDPKGNDSLIKICSMINKGTSYYPCPLLRGLPFFLLSFLFFSFLFFSSF